MTIEEACREHRLASAFDEGDKVTQYWTDGTQVYYRHYPIRHADIESFRHYVGGFSKDRRACYCTSTRLNEADPQTFRALNFAYYADSNGVWTMGGRIKEADVATFEVCDVGAHPLGNNMFVPYGYGKDKERVYYYDFDGKPNCVKKAEPSTFVSLSPEFGKDAKFVFCGQASIPKAKVDSWRLIGGKYSKDSARIFYFNRLIEDADHQTFEVVKGRRDYLQLARDKDRFYNNDRVVDRATFEELLR